MKFRKGTIVFILYTEKNEENIKYCIARLYYFIIAPNLLSTETDKERKIKRKGKFSTVAQPTSWKQHGITLGKGESGVYEPKK